MDKIYIVQHSCSNCPKMHHDDGKRYCGAFGFGKEIDVPVTIFPAWCPLEDAKPIAQP